MQNIRNVTLVGVSGLLDCPTPVRLQSLCLRSDLTINLILAPDHPDFLPEVAAALRITDGVVVGLNLPVLRIAVAERVKVVLYIDSLERVLDVIAEVNEAVYGLDIGLDDVIVGSGEKAFTMRQVTGLDHGLDLLRKGELPAKDALLDAIKHLPDPKAAEHRLAVLCEQEMICDPQGPLVVYISKMMPMVDGVYALGRVFSGTARAGKVRIGGRSASITKVLFDGNEVESVEAGNIVGLVGLDKYLMRSGVISTLDLSIKEKPVTTYVQQSVEVAPRDLPKLVERLKLLSKIDCGVQTSTTEAGGHVISGTGEAHLAECVRFLREKVDLVASEVRMQYRETVTQNSSMTALAKTPNKYTRIWMTAEPMREASNVWCFGPNLNGPNILVDETKHVQYIHEIKDHCISGFQWATAEGPVAEEPLEGVRCNIVEAGLFCDAIHRGGGQIIPSLRRAVFSSVLLAEPALMEPAREASSMVFDRWQLVPGSVFEVGSPSNVIAEAIRQRKGLKPGVPTYVLYYDKL